MESGFATCARCRRGVALPADACPRCGKALPRPAAAEPEPAPVPAAPVAPPVVRSRGRVAPWVVGGALALLLAAAVWGVSALPAREAQAPPFVVGGPTTFALEVVSVPEVVAVGEPFEVKVRVVNVGQSPGHRSVSLAVDGAVVASQATATVDPGGAAFLSFWPTLGSSGVHVLEAGTLNGEVAPDAYVRAR